MSSGAGRNSGPTRLEIFLILYEQSCRGIGRLAWQDGAAQSEPRRGLPSHGQRLGGRRRTASGPTQSRRRFSPKGAEALPVRVLGWRARLGRFLAPMRSWSVSDLLVSAAAAALVAGPRRPDTWVVDPNRVSRITGRQEDFTKPLSPPIQNDSTSRRRAVHAPACLRTRHQRFRKENARSLTPYSGI